MAVNNDTALMLARRTALVLDSEKQSFETVPGKPDEIDSKNQANIRLALTKAGYEFGYDLFSTVAYVSESGDNEQPLDDAILHRLWLGIDEKWGFRPSLDFFHIVLMDFARQFAHHPVRDYLDGLDWDKKKRLDTWLSTYAGAEDTKFNRAVAALVLIAAVKRVRQPGCKFDELLVLQGNQGDGKSSIAKALVPVETWFSDSLQLGDDTKTTIERSRGVWIAELPDLVGQAREVERIKAFLSRHVDGPVRMSYARVPIRVPRQFITIGGTNEFEFLRDQTGNRRFWPVATEKDKFDIEGLIRDRDQLWAEASQREAEGESIRLAEELWAVAAEVQEQFRRKHPWEALIEDKVDLTKAAVRVSVLWSVVGVNDTARHDNRNADVIAAVMRRHGFYVKKKIRIQGKEQSETCWVRDKSVTRLKVEDVVTRTGSYTNSVKGR